MQQVKTIGLWKLGRITGLWKLERMCAACDAPEWLSIFKRDEPSETFILSRNKPRVTAV